MGLILTTFMISQGTEYVLPALIGNLGAIIGSVISVRIMLTFTKKFYKYNPEEDKATGTLEKRMNLEKSEKEMYFKEL